MAKQKWPCETHSDTYVLGLSTLSDLMCIDAQPPLPFLCCPRPPSHHPSSLTSVSLIPTLHLLSPSILFWPYDTHPFFPHAQTISILSDLLYLLTLFIFQHSYAPLHSYVLKAQFPIYPYIIREGRRIVRACDWHSNETVTFRKLVTKYKNILKWMVEYLKKFESRSIKIACVNWIYITKSINLL